MEPPFGSQRPGSVESLTVIVPPYCGAPRVSHQFPVLVVDAVTVTDVVDVPVDVVVGPKDVVAVVVVVVVIVVDDVVVAVVAVVDELQDAKIMEATMRRVINPQTVISPVPPFLFEDFRMIYAKPFSRCFLQISGSPASNNINRNVSTIN